MSKKDQQVDAVVVGAGFAGLYMAYRLRELGLGFRMFEAGSDVGGVWYWNRYPGARCDVESMQYSYSFSEELQQEWDWTERFAGQPEILRYAQHVADRFDLKSQIQFNTRIVSAHFDETRNEWDVSTDSGEKIRCRHLMLCVGSLSASRVPGIEGLSEFKGEAYHTGLWPHEPVSFAGRNVAVIGTGSSGIQSIPKIAEEAAKLYVLQRTPNFSLPAQNAPLTEENIRWWKSDYAGLRRKIRETCATGTLYDFGTKSVMDVSDEELHEELERRWKVGGTNFMAAYTDILRNLPGNERVKRFVQAKIRSAVEDDEVADKLVPQDHPLGSKRLCLDTNYYSTYNRSNVELIDVRANPIRRLTETGVQVGDRHIEVDAVVFATGYDAATGAILAIDIRGRQGQRLADKWQDGPITNLGLMANGFPNMFMIMGPGSPSVLVNCIVAIEQHVEWTTDLVEYMGKSQVATIEPTPKSETAWVQHVNELANETVYPLANSWYLGANIPGKPRVFLAYCGGILRYRKTCDEIAAGGYRDGFLLRSQAGTGNSSAA